MFDFYNNFVRYTVRWMRCSSHSCCILFHPIFPILHGSTGPPTRPKLSAKNRWCIPAMMWFPPNKFNTASPLDWFRLGVTGWTHSPCIEHHEVCTFDHLSMHVPRLKAETKQDIAMTLNSCRWTSRKSFMKKQGLCWVGFSGVGCWDWIEVSLFQTFTKKMPQKISWILPTSSALPFTVRSQELSGNLGGVLASNVVSMHDLTLRRNRVWEGWWNFVK